ncbi:MAG TPA: aa3-type cytochrome c oxidase subunit IV [Caulobacteraceae bacterium]
MADDTHAQHDAEAYQRGEMLIEEQSATYAMVMAMTKWASLLLVVGGVFFVSWLHPGGKFLPAAIMAVIVLVLGVVFLGKKSKH